MLSGVLVGWHLRPNGGEYGYGLTKVVCCDYNAIFKFEANDRCSGDNGLLGMLRRAVVREVACVICAVDIISGLEEVSKVAVGLEMV